MQAFAQTKVQSSMPFDIACVLASHSFILKYLNKYLSKIRINKKKSFKMNVYFIPFSSVNKLIEMLINDIFVVIFIAFFPIQNKSINNNKKMEK